MKYYMRLVISVLLTKFLVIALALSFTLTLVLVYDNMNFLWFLLLSGLEGLIPDYRRYVTFPFDYDDDKKDDEVFKL